MIAMLSEDDRRFVEDVLKLYRALHFSHEALKNRKGITPGHVRFSGFNYNKKDEEEHYEYCQKIIKQQGRFRELDNDNLEENNRFEYLSSLEGYRKMSTAE